MASTFALPGVRAIAGAIHPDWHVLASERFPQITADWRPVWRDPGGEVWATTARVSGGHAFRFGRIADMFVAGDRTLRMTLRGFPDPATVAHVILDCAFPIALTADGALVLHGSAIELRPGGPALVFCGASGAGKSTIAASLSCEGFPVMADDALLIEPGNPVVAVPSYPGLRLWPDAAAAMGLPSSACDRVARHVEKVRVSVESSVAARPLAAIALLEPAERLTIQPIRPRDAAVEIIRHAFRADLTGDAPLRRQLSQAAKVAHHVPMLRVGMPRDLAAVGAHGRALVRHVLEAA